MPQKKEETPVAYYEPVLRDYDNVRNAAARRIYFMETEPDGERPTHGKVLHVKAAEMVLDSFCANILSALHFNAAIGWKKGLPLPDPEDTWPLGVPLQPLAEGVTQGYPEYMRNADRFASTDPSWEGEIE